MELLLMPVEMQEKIIYFLDGASFCRARRVCKLLSSVCSDMENRTPIWKMHCLHDIEQDTMLHMTYSTCKQELVELYKKSKLWKMLYVMWYRTRFVGQSQWLPMETYITLNYDLGPSGITCARILGDSLIIGCKDGHVTLVDSLTGQVENWTVNIAHSVDVTDIKLLRLGDGCESLCNLTFASHVITSSAWGNIKITDLQSGATTECPHILSHVGSIDVWGSFVMVENNHYGNNHCELLTVQILESGILKITNRKTIFPYDWGCSVSQIWQNKALSGGLDQVIFKYLDFQKGQSLQPPSLIGQGIDDCRFSLVHIPDINVESVVFKAGVAMCLTDEAFIHVSIDEGYTWASWNTMEMVGSKAVKAVIWGPLLAVAFVSGQVNVYHLETKDKYLTDFLRRPNAVIHTDSETCYGLDIGDDGEHTVIAVVTEKYVKVVRWFFGDKRNKTLNIT